MLRAFGPSGRKRPAWKERGANTAAHRKRAGSVEQDVRADRWCRRRRRWRRRSVISRELGKALDAYLLGKLAERRKQRKSLSRQEGDLSRHNAATSVILLGIVGGAGPRPGEFFAEPVCLLIATLWYAFAAGVCLDL